MPGPRRWSPRGFRVSLSRGALRNCAACAALVLYLGASAPAAEKIWIAEFGGGWSIPSVWSDNAPPPTDGAADLTLRFRSHQSSFTVRSTHNLGSIFLVNQMALEADGTGPFLIDAQPAKIVRFAGASPRITVSGLGAHTISIPLSLAPVPAMPIEGTGLGDLTISGNITQTASGTGLLIDAPAPAADAGVITLSGTNGFSGGVTLEAGNLAVGNNAALGTGPLRVKGGTLRFAAGTIALPNPIALESDLVVTSSSNSTLATLAGVLSSVTPGTGLNLRTKAFDRLVLSAAASYSGATKIDYGTVGDLRTGARAGILNLTGSGSILNTSSIDIASGGTLWTNGSAAGATNRIADTTPIALRGGRLQFTGSSGSNTQTEKVGAIQAQGFASIGADFSGGGGPNARLTVTSVTRAERGTVDFQGTNLGRTPAASVTNIFFDAAPPLIGGGGAGPDTSIISFAIGDTTTSSTEVFPSLVTYDAAVGVRPIGSAEYVKALPAPQPTNNVWLDGSAVLAANTTANALRLSNGAAISGAATLSLTSGTLLTTTGGEVTISAPLDFGAAEAQIFAQSPITLSGVISGSNGLTKSGYNVLGLRGVNNIAGPLTINAGTVEFEQVEDLGTDAGTITISGPYGALSFAGAGNANLARPIRIASGMVRIEATSGVLEISGAISGEALNVYGNGGTVRLTGANTHNGPTVLVGDVIIDGDEALGSGELRPSGTLRLAAPWTSSRRVTFEGAATIDTAGHDSTLSGLLNGRASLTKAGAGTLSLTAASPFNGTIQINGGTVRLSGAGRVRSGSVRIGSGGRLLLDYFGGEEESRLLDTSNLSLEGGELALVGNPNGPTREKIGGLSASRTTSVLRFSPGPGRTLTLAVRSLSAPSGTLLIACEQLAAPAGQTSARLESTTAPTTAGGLIPGVLATWANEGETFTTYDSSSDAAGVIGVKALRPSDYVAAGTIQNPATPTTAHVVAQNGATATGSSNTIASLTFAPGGTLSLGAGETLNVSSGQLLVRSGGAAVLSGGALELGSSAARLTTLSDIAISSAITGTAGWTKVGPGILTLGSQPANAAPLTIASGPLRVASPEALSAQKLTLFTDAVFDLSNGSATVGEIAGDGTVAIGTGALRLGTLGTSFPVNAKFTGTGTVTLVDNGRGATRTFPETVSGFAGSLVLESGDVNFVQSNHAALGPLVFAGGRVASARAVIFNSDVVLASDLKVDASSVRFVAPATVSGAGTFRITGQEAFLETPLQFTGSTVVQSSQFNPNTLYLSGEGALTNTSGIELRHGQLRLYESEAAFGAANARIPDTAPITIELGTLVSSVDRSQVVMETIGPLRAGPGARVEMIMSPITPPPVAGFAASALERLPGGTLLVSGTALGNTGANPHHELRVATRPALVGGDGTGPNRSLLPWALATTNLQTNFLTWEPGTGLRPVDPTTEFVTGVAAVQQPTNNLRIDSDYTLSGPLTVNALLLEDAEGSGPGRLTVTSGGVLIRQNTIISHPLDFGPAEGQLHLGFSNLDLRGPLTGTGGVTVSGGELTISGTNSVTGPFHITNSRLRFSSLSQLGDNTRISLSDGGLLYTGTSLPEFARDLEVTGFRSHFTTSVLGVTTFSGNVSGSGQLRLATPFGSRIHLTGTSTHTGGMEIGTIVTFASDAALGPGPITLADGVLRATFPWSTSRTILGDGRFDTNGFDVTWSGRVEGVDKIGAGTLTLRGPVTNSIEVLAGAVVLDGAIDDGIDPTSPNIITVAAGATLAGHAVTRHYLTTSGTIAPGGGVGSLAVLDTTFRAGSTFSIELAAADRYDQLRAQGFVRLEGDVALELALSFDPVDGVDTFLLIENDAFDPIDLASGNGYFRFGQNRLSDGEIFTVGAQAFYLKYAGGSGNDIVLLAVPEPGCGILALCGALPLGARHRRR